MPTKPQVKTLNANSVEILKIFDEFLKNALLIPLLL